MTCPKFMHVGTDCRVHEYFYVASFVPSFSSFGKTRTTMPPFPYRPANLSPSFIGSFVRTYTERYFYLLYYVKGTSPSTSLSHVSDASDHGLKSTLSFSSFCSGSHLYLLRAAIMVSPFWSFWCHRDGRCLRSFRSGLCSRRSSWKWVVNAFCLFVHHPLPQTVKRV